jgi:hypothetical protein
MATQTGSNYLVNFKVESVEGTAATGGGSTGERLRTVSSPGLKLSRATVRSAEKRNDANKAPSRLGGKSVAGSYNVEVNVDSFSTLIEAAMRSTWVSPVAITQSTMTSITTTTNTIVAAAGSWVTQGVRAGDVVRLTGHSTAANNDINLRVLSVTTSTITTVGSPLTLNASPDTTFTLTIQKKIAQATTPTRRTFTVEQYLEDADVSEQFVGCRVVSMSFTFQPSSMVTATFGFIGLNRTALATGASPYFTSPTEYTSINLVADDASITYNGAVVTTLTGWTVNFTIDASGQPVLGSLVAPGTYDNDLMVEGSCAATISDFSDLTLFDAETTFEMSILLVEPDAAAPVNFMHLYFPQVKIMDISGELGGDAAYVQTRTLEFQPKVAATGYDAGVCTISIA